MTIGDKLKITLKLKNITGDELAHKLGLSPSTISKYKNNKRIPNSNVLINICAVLGVSVSTFTKDVDETTIIK